MANKTPPPPSAPATATVVAAELRSIPIALLHESKLNPRKRFNETALAELEASIRKSGQLTPILARPYQNGKGPAFEIAAGHRRRRAGERAGLTEMFAIVREMDDAEFMEILTIENLQREDVHPLEEAQGFADLIKHAGYDVAKISDRTGRSHRYVYDRFALLKLIPELKEAFLADEFTVAHAVLLARLSADDQQRILVEHGALFTFEHGHALPGEPALDLDDRRKPMSVRELQRWIDEHVRFDVSAPEVQELFPATAAVVAPAIEQKEKIISITHESFVQPDAKEEGERTWGPRSWKRADGEAGSKECEHSVIGVIVVGPGRGESFRVCTAKKTCTTHWGAEIRQAKKRAKEAIEGSSAGATDRHAEAREREQRRQVEFETRRAAFREATPKILDAIAAQVRKRAAGAHGPLGQLLLRRYVRGAKPKQLTPGANAEDLVRYLAFAAISDELSYYNAHESFPKLAKSLGVDVAKILKGDDTPAPPKAPAAKKAGKKKARR